ncbi:hypothetical protein ABZ726_16310 [Streptomyces hundungensis]|uniref:hypothetical protein n=1 Tax=Streptomyces hundungensis TaxID=1077946 RepID=UPI00340073C8
MGLTSTTTVAVAVCCTMLGIALVVWQWPRLSGLGWRPVLGRVGLLCAVQLLLFSTVGLAANKSFLFYGSWADLFGRQDGVGVLGAESASSPGVKVAGKQKVDVPGAGKPSIGGEGQKATPWWWRSPRPAGRTTWCRVPTRGPTRTVSTP